MNAVLTSPKTLNRLAIISEVFDTRPSLVHYRHYASDFKAMFPNIQLSFPDQDTILITGQSHTGLTGHLEIRINGTRLHFLHWVSLDGKQLNDVENVYVRAGQHMKRTAESYRLFERMSEFTY